MPVKDPERYTRQILCWGAAKQQLIEDSAILVAGVGGLGAMVSQLLARAGVAVLHLVDDGEVAWTDLHRQALYAECDVGRKKVLVARERLLAINSGVEVIVHDSLIDAAFCMPEDVHCVADCLDNFSGRFDLHAALPAGMFFVHGGIQGSQGQVLTLLKGQSQPLAEIMAGCVQPPGPIPVTPDSVCVIAGIMANELFNAMAGAPKLLDRFLVVDLAGFTCSFLEV